MDKNRKIEDMVLLTDDDMGNVTGGNEESPTIDIACPNCTYVQKVFFNRPTRCICGCWIIAPKN